jgi:diguanylate cyclase (GGDEF)-like protein
MEEIIKKISEETINELEKTKKPAYPLYYKEVFVNLAREDKIFEQINPKLLCVNPLVSEELINKTVEAVKDIHKTSSSIKEESIKLLEEIEPIEVDDIKSLVIKYSSNLLEQINKMESKINELESELDRAYKELLIDPLTKAYNKKALEKDLNEILKVGKSKDLDLALIVLDLDHFKEINDTYGHLVGDFILKKVVEIVKRIIRKEYKIYRIGGDEFAIFMNRTNIKGAEKVTNRIMETISKTKMKYKDNLIKVTVSIGITMHKKGDTIETILKRADKAVFEAKKNQNNYVIK